MRARTVSAVLLGLASLVACAGPAHPPPASPEPEPEAAPETPFEEPEEPGLAIPEDHAAPEGPSCFESSECGAGMACRGAPGCTSEWACGEPRECMEETVTYCDCNGATFYAPGGCPGRPYAHLGPCSTGQQLAADEQFGIPNWDEQITDQDRLCTSNDACGSGQTCFGVAGCMTEWRCTRTRGCTRDRVEYCGCDGVTFSASSTCPGRPFVHRGACRQGEAIARAEASSTGATSTGATSTADPATSRTGATTSTTVASAATGGTTIARAPAGLAPSRAASAPASTAPALTESGERICQTSRDCRRGEVCQGPEGCGMTWTCGRPERECVRDTQVFCDCEGRDFRASMFCPGRPYAHRGSCEIDRLLGLSGAAVR